MNEAIQEVGKSEAFFREGKFILRLKQDAALGEIGTVLFAVSPTRRVRVAVLVAVAETEAQVGLNAVIEGAEAENVKKLMKAKKFNRVDFSKILGHAQRELSRTVNKRG